MMRILLAAFLLSALAACSGPMTSQTGRESVGVDGYYGYGVADRDLRLTLSGNGSAGQSWSMEQDAFARLIEGNLHTPSNRAPSHVTLAPGPSARDNYRLVFLFNPGVLIDGQGLCDGHSEQQAPVAGQLRVVASFCVAGRSLTEVAGQTDLSGPDDPRLNSLLDQMMQILFRSPLRESNHLIING